MRITEVQGYSISHLVNNPFSSAWSDDNKMALITDKGVHILALTPNPKSSLTSLSCSRHSIKTDTSLPTSDVGIDVGELIWHLEKEDAYNLVLDTTLAPMLTKAAPLIPCVKQVAWSALGILNDQRCLLATLTDMGGLSLYKMINMEWVKQTSVSEQWVEHCQTLWREENLLSLKEQVEELERRSTQAKITAMCWSHRVYNFSSLFFTGTRSGEVAIWEVSNNSKNVIIVKLLHTFKTDMNMIVALHWFSLSESTGLLIVANFDGNVKCFNFVSYEDNTYFVIKETYPLWSENDKMKISYMDCWEWYTGLLLIVAKEAFVLAFLLEYSGKRVCHGAYRCCDTNVSGLSQLSQNSVLMTTRSGRFTHISLSIDNDKMKLVAKCVENYVNLSHMACYGISTSYNKAICGVVLSANQVFDHLILREPTQVILCTLPELINPYAILQASVQPLRTMWDCYEVLRVQTIQKTFIPDLECRRSVLDTLSIENLTQLLWMITFAVTAEEDENRIIELQNLRIEVEMLVLSCHLFKRVATLLSIEILTDFQLRSLGLLKKWLKYMSILDPEYITTLMAASSLLEEVEELGVIVPSLELCGICRAEVPELKDHYYSVCVNGHKLPRCSLNLVQCSQVPYYICSLCGVLAHKLSVKECGYYCVFCDGILRVDEEILPSPDDDLNDT